MFYRDGVYVMVDGQFGSTGKGVLAAYLAQKYASKIDVVVSNAGPNSGHTSYVGDQKVVLKQLPTFGVVASMYGMPRPIYLSAGSIIDPDILNAEVEKYGVKVHLSSRATLIRPEDKDAEHSGSMAAVAGTRQGVGAALARKVMRDPSAVVEDYSGFHPRVMVRHSVPDYRDKKIFMEVSQGFSLGINSEFYPKVTSRECTVMQAMADARMAPQLFGESYMTIRTFPIRVGNIDGHSSGDWYLDQRELTWEELGEQPEMTTVTQRVRRVATFSWIQYKEALLANQPRYVFVNFMNYIKKPDDRQMFVARLRDESRRAIGREPTFLFGYGPRSEDVKQGVI